jgi:hypothetical protein
LLVDPTARRCSHCGQNVRRKRPKVLGEESRIGSTLLPIDRMMIERLDTDSSRRGRKSMPPVAWHGRFTTTPLAEPDFSATPSPIATPLAPPTVIEPTVVAPAARTEPEPPATVGALALDLYTRPVPAEEEPSPVPETATAVPVPVEPPSIAEIADVPDVATLPEPFAPEPRSAPPAPPAAKPTPHEELEPDVRALVDELYEQARAELSGNDLGFFMPAPADPIIDEPPSDAIAAPPMFDDSLPPLFVEPERPIVAPAPKVEAPRTGWVPAIQADPRRRSAGAAE